MNVLTMLEAIAKINRYSSGYRNADDFHKNERDFEACMMNFIIIGEMVARLSDEFITKNPQSAGSEFAV
ncbi:MAG: DUF86 domain-containing protein [candidate division KSB1 bacterium]|nr:DUF86 domain-containing protein [candidate division KSB1 bacterium]MDZ7285669.1 DUF86 domain-containing protein [candidate division KSB1 bacterium]MDZ7298701.1 DUF86 domain-containing protein [candidate division KSB1 bacterium]MDZ7307550.1 DUF86 domain-containing protein [candidate division KSB1 bacterium]MDZ7349566.1 DUF86 domain-containing protein [candidate division KSB1 bacterium]